MPLVTITGNAWDHSRTPIPAALMPELWFRPNRSNIAGSLLAGVESKATLNTATGAFTVEVDSAPGITYRPFMRWLLNPSEALPERRAWGEVEWPFDIHPDIGGVISDLVDFVEGIGLVYVSETVPNAALRYQFQFNPQTQRLYERRITW